MERTELYVRVGASVGCFLGVGYGLHDIMQTYNLPFSDAVCLSIKHLPNIAKPAYWTMTRDVLAGLGAGGLVGGLVGKIAGSISKRKE